MQFTVLTSLPFEIETLILPVFENEPTVFPKPYQTLVKLRFKNKDFTGKAGEMVMLFPEEKGLPSRVLVWGLGTKDTFSGPVLRGLAAELVRKLKTFSRREVALWCLPGFAFLAQELAEGVEFGNFSLAKFKTGKEKEEIENAMIGKISFIVKKDTLSFRKALKKGFLIAEAVCRVRDLVNRGPSLKHVDYLVEQSKGIARKHGYSLRILDQKQLEKKGMHGILGVNRGSDMEAKMVVLEYTPPKTDKKKPIVFIGKGIIFDSGGYNLKPGQSLQEMQLDMAGAAVIMGLFEVLKPLQLHHHVVGIFPLTDNVINAKAQKPSDIVTTYSGKTVEIVNTDAEGRMILCDAITYAIRHFQPEYIIDIATLTGVCVLALGERFAGLFGNDAELLKKLKHAGETCDELLWELPIHPDDRKKMKSKIADLRNHDFSPQAGALKAAAFLEEFVEDKKWAHIDIAGPAFVKDPKKYESPMGTGFGVRLFVTFLEELRKG